jgi:predicted TIM-barrel fold metal-dependent hydrolase
MSAEVRGKQQKPVTFYLHQNFYITTAGNFRTQALIDTLLEMGSDRILYSVDYPYEKVQEQTDRFDSLPISQTDRRKIGRENAVALLRLGSEDAAAAKVSEKRPQPAK